MKTSCLINNYNYRDYVGQAIASALRQTVPFDELIVVDDGSTDGSQDVIRAAIEGHPEARFVVQDNAGQMSAVNTGFAAADGDLIFFLDADDLYEADYLQTALAFYHAHPACDLLFCGMRHIGQSSATVMPFAADTDLGYTACRTFFRRDWIGGPTSSLSLRRAVLEKILPCPFLEDLRCNADEVLVYGASLIGARVFFLAALLVAYRVHGRNHWYGKYDHDAVYQALQDGRIRRVQQYLLEKYPECLSPGVFLAEFRNRPRTQLLVEGFRHYLHRRSLSLTQKAAWLAAAAGIYLKHKLTGGKRSAPAESAVSRGRT